MLNKIAFVSVLGLSIITTAHADNAASITEKDAIAVVATAETTWTIAAVDGKTNLTKLREFHDVGDRGVQQIDYVVSCVNGELALAGFNLLTANAYNDNRTARPTYSDLSFYKPVIQHDINIVSNVCGGRLAMLGSPTAN